VDWEAKLAWALAQHEERASRPTADGERPDFHGAAIAGASWAAGLAALMLGRGEQAAGCLRRAADEYRASWATAPPGSWGRPLAALRCRLIAGDGAGAHDDARSALSAGAAAAEGLVAAYCAALALLALGRDDEARERAATLVGDERFSPQAVAEALVALAERDADGYARALDGVLDSFETRNAFLEDVRVADTVLVLDRLARDRGIAPPRRRSELLPSR
jgi:tetratricopeptide (TPR) repeat protein